MEVFNNITFANPEFFALLLLVPLAVWYFRRQRGLNFPFYHVPTISGLSSVRSWREWAIRFLPILRGLVFTSMVIAMARPQEVLKEQEIKAEGIDIFLVMDVSTSMLAQDFKPDRLEVSKKVAAEFVDNRPYDRIGLAAFAGEAFTQCPLTTDHRVLKEFIGSLKCGYLTDGTAIGMGLATAVNRLKDSEAKSKVVILLTDGVNNAGYISPSTAAELARTYDVKVYTIGAGSQGLAMVPNSRLSTGRYIYKMARVELDEQTLQEIAKITRGRYFRATSAEGLKDIYEEIDKLEKTEMDVTSIKTYDERFRPFLLFGFLLLALDMLLRLTVLRTLP